MSCLIVSCSSKGPSGPEPEAPRISGQLTDATGRPLTNVPISLAYAFEGISLWQICYPSLGRQGDLVAATINIHFDLEIPAFVDLTFFDYMRRPVITLVQRSMQAGRHSVTWNSLDAAGRRVPTGAYFSRLEILDAAGKRHYDQTHLVVHCSPEDDSGAPHTVTNATGWYTIEMGLLPIGEAFRYLDDSGSFRDFMITDSVTVQAGVFEGSTFRSTSSRIRVADRTRDLRVDLTLP